MRSAWDRLAEALGIRTEANWDAVNKRRQMQQYGTMDRRTNQGPTPYFKTPGQQQRMQQQRRGPVNPNAMAQIPVGTDVPGQENPLFAPPSRTRPSLSRSPNSPTLPGGSDEEDEDMMPGSGY